jgi:RNA polymerase sigma-70 factor, ECF subfamily
LTHEYDSVTDVQLTDASVARLIKKIGEGDSLALMSLFDSTSRLVLGIIARILEDRTLAEEVLLDFYTWIARQSGSYDSKRLKPMEWLISAARARALAAQPWHKQGRKTAEFHTGYFETEATVSPDRQKLARSAMESLAPAQREVLENAFYSGLSCAEIAAQIGKPLGAVKTHARLGIGKIDELFRPLFETGQ